MRIARGAEAVLKTLEEAGYEAYLVGGCVRDQYRGVEPHDYDIATSAPPDAVAALFPADRVIATGLRHGTVTVLIGKEPFEVTTFREEIGYSDHRHPDAVRFTANAERDLARRDFTMNAMARDLSGNWLDPFGGRADLDRGVIRCVGVPAARFEEDALRILRALRFAARLGFTIEPETAKAMREKKETLREIAGERIAAEWTGLLQGAHAASVLNEFSDIIRVFLPEAVFDAAALAALAAAPADPGIRWALLFPARPEEARAGLNRLRCSNETKNTVLTLAREAAAPCPADRAAVHRRLAALGPALFEKSAAMRRALGQPGADRAAAEARALLAEGACLSLKDLAVSGRDLTERGFTGEAVGKTLNALLEAVLDEKLPNQRDALLQAAEKPL